MCYIDGGQIKILFGFWETLIPDELPEPPNKTVKNSLRSILFPVLILKGECDYIKWDVTYEYKDLIKNSIFLCLDGVGHMPFLEKPDLVLESIRSFLLDQVLPLPEYLDEFSPWK